MHSDKQHSVIQRRPAEMIASEKQADVFLSIKIKFPATICSFHPVLSCGEPSIFPPFLCPACMVDPHRHFADVKFIPDQLQVGSRLCQLMGRVGQSSSVQSICSEPLKLTIW